MIAPKRGTKKYQKVLDKGCGGSKDYYGEFDCDWLYEWSCDDCPIVVEKEYEENLWLVTLTEKHNTTIEASTRQEAIEKARVIGFDGDTIFIGISAQRVKRKEK